MESRYRVALVLLVLMDLAWLVFIARGIADDRRFSATAVSTTARVTDVAVSRSSADATVTFADRNGTSVTTRLDIGFSWPPQGTPSVGDTVRIDYLPASPGEVRRAGDHIAIAEPVMGLVFVLPIHWLVWRAWREGKRPPRPSTGRHSMP